jgi:hypothetical protein
MKDGSGRRTLALAVLLRCVVLAGGRRGVPPSRVAVGLVDARLPGAGLKLRGGATMAGAYCPPDFCRPCSAL